MVVLDSWALLAYLKNEPAAGRIEETWLSSGAAISSVNLGEALYIRMRERGEGAAVAEVDLIRNRCHVIDADWTLIFSAAQIKAGGGLSYADAFCISAAKRIEAPLWTGDPEIVEKADALGCEVVDLREP